MHHYAKLARSSSSNPYVYRHRYAERYISMCMLPDFLPTTRRSLQLANSQLKDDKSKVENDLQNLRQKLCLVEATALQSDTQQKFAAE